jgi:acyl carrier protein
MNITEDTISFIEGLCQWENEEIFKDTLLAEELGLDSLDLAEIAAFSKSEFGVRLPNIKAMRTVGDVIDSITAQMHEEEE